MAWHNEILAVSKNVKAVKYNEVLRDLKLLKGEFCWVTFYYFNTLGISYKKEWEK